ncbi:hypothetical protein SAMN05421874_12448 [Nonomuraea maritima]|uniref:Uncharacterized protein n=1 Tax=Nonomuraea maritima TaxID=683260 RepID=A0A1G9L6V1_9ACTN|nr:hypothetical protein [Nonomuraea maritima]SDL57671.1 hypothetical protein SAMN05421874_12448 [Nonomuraea maritima]
MRTLTATLLAGLVLAAGCGTQSPPAAPTSATPERPPVVSSPAADSTSPIPPETPQPVKPVGNAVNVHKIAWRTAKPVAGGKQVRLVWWSGVAPCTVLDRVAVKETRKTVTITLYEGTAPQARNMSCIMIAVEKTTTVTLKQPLGNRKLVNGGKP